MMQVKRTKLEVLEATSVGERNIAVVKVLSGEPLTSMVLKSEETGFTWQVNGSAFVPAQAWESGVKGLLLERVQSTGGLKAGEHLTSV